MDASDLDLDLKWFIHKVHGCRCLALAQVLREKAVRKNGREHHSSDENLLFPPSVVARVLLPSALRDVLECDCAVCRNVPDRITFTDQDMIDAIASQTGDRGRRQFAALVWIGAGFATRYIHFKSRVPGQGQDQIQTELFALAPRAFPDPAEAASMFVKLFDYAKRLFNAPTIELSLTHQELSRNNLPFINEKPLSSRGAQYRSLISEFEIQQEFRGGTLTRENVPEKLVRKELPWEGSENERTTLQFLASCKKPNLIKLLFYYKYGDSLNLVFKRYPCSLEGVLSGSEKVPGGVTHPTRYERSILQHWLWQGMVDVIAALGFFHDPTSSNPSLEGPIIAAHFDIKPANILVDDNGDLVVTDFGEAKLKFQQRGLGTFITRGAGTTAYRPPDPLPVELGWPSGNKTSVKEADQNRLWSRAYDIWSTACVITEVVAYIVYGHKGFNNFRQARLADDDEEAIRSANFWRKNLKDGKVELKHSVRTMLESFRRYANIEVDRYLISVIDLLEEMFIISAQKRPTMARCLSIVSQNFPSDNWPLLDDNEVQICGLATLKPLRSMRTEFRRNMLKKERCKMYLNKNNITSRMRLIVEFDKGSNNSFIVSDSARIVEERFKPKSLFKSEYKPYEPLVSCSFQVLFPTSEFIFEGPPDYYSFLAAVTKHKPLKPFRQYYSPSKDIRNPSLSKRLNDKKAPRETYEYGQIQIWMELSQEKYSENFLESFAVRRASDVSFASQVVRHNRHDSAISTYPNIAANGVPRRSIDGDPIPCRLVIMIPETGQQKSRYITLDLAKRSHTIEMGYTWEDNPHECHVTLKTFRNNLKIGSLEAERGDYPGFPLDPEILLKGERQEVAWIELTFLNIEGRQNFESLYNELGIQLG